MFEGFFGKPDKSLNDNGNDSGGNAMAGEKKAYALTDRGTWISFADKMGDKNTLTILVQGDKALFNQYSVITVNPAQCPKVKKDLAKKFEDWWVAPATQQKIAAYTLKGKQLFFPNADK